MTTIITGNFQEQAQAVQAMSALDHAGFAADQTTTFFVGPAGQHAILPAGGDGNESIGTENAAGGTASGSAAGGAIGLAVGIATLPVLGPAAVIAGTGVGAYVGSLYGALGNLENDNNPETPAEREALRLSDRPRQSGVLVAVAAPAGDQQANAIRILQSLGATDIERPEGTIIDGAWTDFDPLKPLQLVVG